MAWAEKLPSGKWSGCYRDDKGRKRRAQKTFPNKTLAKRAAEDCEADIRQGRWRDPDLGRLLFGDWVEQWWTRRRREDSTLETNRARIDKYLIPRWGDIFLSKITVGELRNWIADLEKLKLSNWTIHNVVGLMRQALDAAIEEDLLTVNPAKRIIIEQPKSGRHVFYQETDIRDITRHMSEEWRLITWALTWTGLRWGELAGLHVRKVDLARQVITVQHTLVERTGNVYIKEYPKDVEARTVPIPEVIASWFSEHILHLERRENCALPHRRRHENLPCPGGGLVFRHGRRGYVSRHAYNQRIWKPALCDANEERRASSQDLITVGRPHDLRHTYGSWLAQRGVPLYDIQVLMGHSNPNTTKIYAHFGPQDHHSRALIALNSTQLVLRSGMGQNVGQNQGQHDATGVQEAS